MGELAPLPEDQFLNPDLKALLVLANNKNQ